MNKTYKIIFTFCILSLFFGRNSGEAQELNLIDNVVDRLYTPYSTDIKNNSFYQPISLYDFNSNPSLLMSSGKKTNMRLGYVNESDKNGFQRPFEEDRKSTNLGYIDLTYMIDTIQVIHSFIKFNNSYSSDRHYIFNLYPYRGNPYLLGDENSGTFSLQMLTLETDYAREIASNLTMGVLFSYNVGNSVNKYFPKPTADYLEIGTRLSLGYKINDQLTAGVFGDYFRTYEEIQYEVSYTSPKIFKFRGNDYPFILLGTSSLNRRNEDNGFGGGAELRYILNNNFTVFLTGKAFTNEEKVTDGVTVNPQLQGKWKENTGEGNLTVIYSNEDYELRAGGIFEIDKQSGRRPTLKESILKRNIYSYSGFAGGKYRFNSDLTVYFLYQLLSNNLKVDDYVNYVSYEVPSLTNQVSAGLMYDFSEYIGASLNYMASIYSPTVNNIYTRDAAEYFYTYFLPEIEYYQTNYFSNSIIANIVYHYGILGDLGLNARLNFLKSDGKGSRDFSEINAYINLFIF